MSDCALPTHQPNPQFAEEACRGLAVLQCCLAFILVTLLIAAPPPSGRMLLLPMNGIGRDGLARIAIAHGARLVAPGPLDGSLVVTGDSLPLIAALMPLKALVLNSAIAGCGPDGVRS